MRLLGRVLLSVTAFALWPTSAARAELPPPLLFGRPGATTAAILARHN